MGEITEYIEEVFLRDDCFLIVKVSLQRIQLLQLEVTMSAIAESILRAKLGVPVRSHQLSVHGQSVIRIQPEESNKMSLFYTIQYLKQALQHVVVKGLPTVSRCVIHADEKTGKSFKLLVEGSNFQGVLATPGVDPKRTSFNNALDVAKVLGMWAAISQP